MSIALPPPIAAYFAAETRNAAALSRCFTEDAVVADERHEHRGRAAIAAWNAAAVATYAMTTEPLSLTTDASHADVRARVTGTFPGSPIELRFRFTLAADLITRLEITP